MADVISIGKGEYKSIIFKITDNDSLFLDTDKLLFAVRKNINDNLSFAFSEEILIGDLTPVIVDGKNVYSFLVNITSQDSRKLSGNYYYDITLITINNEEKPLIAPTLFSIIDTVGASVEKRR